MQGTAGENES